MVGKFSEITNLVTSLLASWRAVNWLLAKKQFFFLGQYKSYHKNH